MEIKYNIIIIIMMMYNLRHKELLNRKPADVYDNGVNLISA